MSKLMLRWAAKIESFADRIWYLPFLSLLAAADLFILAVPTDGLLVTTTMLRPRRWLRVVLWVTLGSALGSMAFTAAVQAFGLEVLGSWLGGSGFGLDNWGRSTQFLENYGAVALTLVCVSPVPINVGVLASALFDMRPAVVFAAVFVGRLARYLLLAWLATHAPRLLGRLGGVRSEVKGIQEADKELSAK